LRERHDERLACELQPLLDAQQIFRVRQAGGEQFDAAAHGQADAV
jgi:hypothetical protein